MPYFIRLLPYMDRSVRPGNETNYPYSMLLTLDPCVGYNLEKNFVHQLLLHDLNESLVHQLRIHE
jgi:hypothetical protein